MSTNAQTQSSGFEFLRQISPVAEESFRDAVGLATTRPSPSLVAARTFAESLLSEAAERRGAPALGQNGNDRETAEAFINRLREDNIITIDLAKAFHAVRMRGNQIAHGKKIGTEEDARKSVDDIRFIAAWFRDEVLVVMNPALLPRTRDEYRAAQVKLQQRSIGKEAHTAGTFGARTLGERVSDNREQYPRTAHLSYDGHKAAKAARAKPRRTRREPNPNTAPIILTVLVGIGAFVWWAYLVHGAYVHDGPGRPIGNAIEGILAGAVFGAIFLGGFGIVTFGIFKLFGRVD